MYKISLDSATIYDAQKLELEHTWTLGHFVLVGNYLLPRPLYIFKTIAGMWRVLNHTICSHEFRIKSTAPEYWLFKEGNIPKWKEVKEKYHIANFVELIFKAPTDGGLLDVILLTIGETIPSSDDIIGIRIKPTESGGRVDLWIINNSSVCAIREAVISVLAQYGKVKCKYTIC